MTGAETSPQPDPLRDWIELRLERHCSDDEEDRSAVGDVSADSMLHSIERVEHCANLLHAVWPLDGALEPEVDQPEQLGRFEIRKLLGRGGMGNVFLAFDPTLQREVALKVPRYDVVGNPELRERFLFEARAAAKLDHANLVEVYDAGMDGAMCYIASAYCDGPDLAQWLDERNEPVPVEAAARLVQQLAAGMQCCHENGIIHRDLKPANILLSPNGSPADEADSMSSFVPKITDFGLARALEESLLQTRSSVIVGTPLYMAPEQAEGRLDEVGPPTDVFALGAVLYELLTGRPPYEGKTALTVLCRIQAGEPDAPGRIRRGVPPGLEAICMKCLRRVAAERYATAAEVGDDLERWLDGRPISARRYTIRDRFRTWSRQPERVRDAGLFTIVWNCLIALACCVHVVVYLLDIAAPIVPTKRIMLESLAVAVVHLGFSWVGWRILLKDSWAFPIGFVSTLLMWLASLNAALGGTTPFDAYEQHPEAKYLMMSIFSIVSTAHLIVFLIATRALMHERRRAV